MSKEELIKKIERVKRRIRKLYWMQTSFQTYEKMYHKIQEMIDRYEVLQQQNMQELSSHAV